MLDGVSDRLERIEQNLNSNSLICRGPAVEELINKSSSTQLPTSERLKGEVCSAVCGEEITGVDVNSLQLTIFGRNKKCIKLNCVNPSSKLHLLKKARERRPEGFYLSEFLTANKLKVYYNLRQLKKQHPNKIKSVFTRGGNILYTLHNSNQVFQATAISDLSNIVGTGTPVSDSGAGVN